jgi:hypothetical protein
VSIACKIGTVPTVIDARDKRTPLEIGRIIRIKEHVDGQWSTAIVRRVDADGYFQADRI